MFYLLMLHMVHQDHLDQELGQNLLVITHIQVEEVLYIQKQTPVNGPFHKSVFNYSYSRSYFSCFLQEFFKQLICCFSQKASYASMMIDPVNN